jgi:ascorbate-specific PTS system EIIC-type component UlaA
MPILRESIMSLTKIWSVVLFFILLSVPWWFTSSESTKSIAGFPDWVVYSFVVTLLFAIAVAWIISKHWNKLSEVDDDE